MVSEKLVLILLQPNDCETSLNNIKKRSSEAVTPHSHDDFGKTLCT